MKKGITKEQQNYINKLLKKRKQRLMEQNLITTQTIYSKNEDIERMVQYDLNNRTGPFCGGFTYEEVDIINYQHNNFK